MTSLIFALLLTSALCTVAETRPSSDLRLLHDILEETQKQLDQQLQSIENALDSGDGDLLEKLQRNRRQTTEGLSVVDLKSVKRTRCYFNPISC